MTLADETNLLGWCVIGNISDHLHGGPDPDGFYQGTKMFAPATKVFLGDAYWGNSGDRLHVVGLHRGSKKFVDCVVGIEVLMNLRLQSVYSKRVWMELCGLNVGCFAVKEEAESYLTKTTQAWNAHRLGKAK